MERLAGRGRGDDDPSVVEKRFKTYENDTLPIVKQYEEKGKLVRVDANGTKEEVFERVAKYFE